VLWIFIAFKNSSSLARFEPANLGGKHDNHYTTEEDHPTSLITAVCWNTRLQARKNTAVTYLAQCLLCILNIAEDFALIGFVRWANPVSYRNRHEMCPSHGFLREKKSGRKKLQRGIAIGYIIRNCQHGNQSSGVRYRALRSTSSQSVTLCGRTYKLSRIICPLLCVHLRRWTDFLFVLIA
jgi:hypothetical protein